MYRHHMFTALLLASTTASVATADDIDELLAAPLADPGAPYQPDPSQGRACRGDLITLDLPVGQALPPAFVDATSPGEPPMQRLARDVTERLTAWVQPGQAGEGLFTRPPKRAVLARVLDEHHPRGADHWLLAFTNGDGKRVRVLPLHACALVKQVRDEARDAAEALLSPSEPGREALAYEVAERLSIARECDATAQVDWHLTALDPAEPPGVFSGPGRGSATLGPVVDVAVVDGPMTSAGLVWSGAEVGARDPVERVHHAHADAMARLVREAAPAARIHGYRGLYDGPGGTPTTHLARTLARALVDATGRRAEGRPQIVNLSLGWPPEAGQPSELRGPSCEVIEDPIGEPVQALLIDAARAGVVIVAAAGNRRGPMPLAPGIIRGHDTVRDRHFPCAADSPILPSYGATFFPAAWARVPTCVDGTLRTLPIIDVGAYAETARAPLGEARLYAPGLGVPLAPVPSALGDVLPDRISGTSAAAALTSGLIARLYAEGRSMPFVFEALDAEAVVCGGHGHLRRCPKSTLSRGTSNGAVKVVSATGAGSVGMLEPPFFDRFVGSLGPQPPEDPCGGDCRLIINAQTGLLALRMRFDGPTARLGALRLERWDARGWVGATTLGGGVLGEVNDQIGKRKGNVALDVTGVPLPGGVYTAGTSFTLGYVLDDGSGRKPTALRRSVVEPAKP